EPGALGIVIAARQARREVRLALPEPQLSARLLRGEFEPAEHVHGGFKRSGKLSSKQPPLISFDGESVAVPLLGENAVRIYSLPRGPKRLQSPPKLERWGKQKWLLTGTLVGYQFYGVIPGESSLEFWRMRDFQGRGASSKPPSRPPPEDLDIVPGRARWLPSALVRGGPTGSRLFVLSGTGNLLSWSGGWAEIRYQREDSAVCAICYADKTSLLYLKCADGCLNVVEYRYGKFEEIDCVPALAHTRDALFCGRRRDGLLRLGYAFELNANARGGDRGSVWRVISRERGHSSDYEAILAADWKVEGVALAPDRGVHLIALRPDRRVLVSIGAQQRTTLYESPYPITAVTVAPDCDVIALIDQLGRLVVLRDQGRSVLLYTGGGDG
ncbi:MAG: hypothetical protein ACREP7_04450, partial [Lysobacter sp.]